jgi:predicted amidohydrolase
VVVRKKTSAKKRSYKPKSSTPDVLVHKEPLLNLGDYLTYLLPRLSSDRTMPKWPPDVFGTCMGVLAKCGGYNKGLSNWPPTGANAKNWAKSIASLAKEWRNGFMRGVVPIQLEKQWDGLLEYWNTELEKIADHRKACQLLLGLCASADDACQGVGLPIDLGKRLTLNELKFYNYADLMLSRECCGSTLGAELHPLNARILPKMHTPQNGLTCRSLSHHLALCTATDIKAKWILTPVNEISQESINVLVIPWPVDIMPSQFSESIPLPSEMRNMPDKFGFFTVHSNNNAKEVVRHIEDVYATAVQRLGSIDWIVLPEAALSPTDFEAVQKAFEDKNCVIIAGIGRQSTKTAHGENRIAIDIPLMETLSQRKHHRWKLDFPQIRQYGLGGRLNPKKQWWEHIDLENRELLFFSLRPWMVMAILICEDLARPDPVGDLVRAVGPNLVLALLMDGPQLKERWGARYATTLADDPGCSVLTVTSTGMSKLSQPASGVSRSRVIALWKDALTGGPVEIELEPGADAIVLSLSVRHQEEWSADGRSDGNATGYTIISGIHPITKGIK